MAPRANKYEYDPLPVPGIPPQLLTQAPSYWDELAKIQAVQAQQADEEVKRANAQRAQEQLAADKEQKALFEANPNKSIDELLPEIQKIVTSHGGTDQALEYQRMQRQQQRESDADARSMFSSLAKVAPEKALEVWNKQFGSSYGNLSGLKQPSASEGGVTWMYDEQGNPVPIRTRGMGVEELQRKIQEENLSKSKPSKDKEQDPLDVLINSKIREQFPQLFQEPAKEAPKTKLSEEDKAAAEKERNTTVVQPVRRKGRAPYSIPGR